MTVIWLVVLFPITVPVALTAVALNWSAAVKGQRAATLRHPLVWTAVGVCFGIVVLGGTFASGRIEPPPDHPAPAYAVAFALALQIGLAAVAVVRTPAPRRGVVGVMLVVLWVSLIATWLAVWAIEAGGTMGAL